MNGHDYLSALQTAYRQTGQAETWNEMMRLSHGISEAEKQALYAEYPLFPESLMQMLERIDGTYYRAYPDGEVTEYFFGSDVDDGTYPYYLYSFQDIMEHKNCAAFFADLFYDFFVEPDADYGIYVDDRIRNDPEHLKWLRFSDCMNNGGTSSLYIDFTPSEKGTPGQIVRFLHDPDELRVIAESFDAFLDMLVRNGMRFLQAEEDEAEED